MTARSSWPAGLILVFLSCVATQAAVQHGALQQRLAAARGVQCTFSLIVTGTWKAGAPEAGAKPTRLTLGFTNVNVDEGTADAEATFGGSYVVVRHTTDYLHLMQTHGTGPLYVTTIFARESKDGRMLAVHTRHEFTDAAVVGFTSRPETYLGDCVVH